MLLIQDMGDKMHRGIKKLAISAAIVAAVLSVLVLTKYLSASSALPADNSHRLAAAMSNQHLDIGKYRTYLEDTALAVLLLLLPLCRFFLMRKSQD